jgi:hypothetical protein
MKLVLLLLVPTHNGSKIRLISRGRDLDLGLKRKRVLLLL